MPIPDTIITIPTKRPPPVRTLESYNPGRYATLIIADPEVFDAHVTYYLQNEPSVYVVSGAKGMGAQSALCYSESFKAGYLRFFRMDDDLALKTFVHKDGHFPDLAELIPIAEQCLDTTKTSHAGFANGGNRYWMSDVGTFKRTWGLIHGGANIAYASADSSPYMDPLLVRGEDIYRTCSHRRLDGAVGRIAFIGFDKSKSTVTAGKTSIAATQEQIEASRDMILEKFAGMVTCNGWRLIDAGKTPIYNWRMKKSKWDKIKL